MGSMTYIQIKSTVQLTCFISYLLVNAEVDQTTPLGVRLQAILYNQGLP